MAGELRNHLPKMTHVSSIAKCLSVALALAGLISCNGGEAKLQAGANPGAVNVLDGDDQKASLPFEGRLFPDQTRVFTSSWDDPPLFGDFDAEASIKTGPRKARDSEDRKDDGPAKHSRSISSALE